MTAQTKESTTEALAIHGGPKAFTQRTGKPQPKLGVEEFLSIAERFGFSPEALTRLRAAVRDEDLGGGPHLGRWYTNYAVPKGAQFEQLAREKFGVRFALGISSGTAALHSAFVGVGVGPGTEVIVPALGFCATGLAVTLAGGVPIFCDVDESLQMDPRKLAARITPRTVAVVPTHHWSNVCDMDPILKIAREHHLKVVEDCAQTPGGKYRGRYVGTLGDVGCFSISSYKIIGGGEGGLVITNDERTFDRIRQCAEGGGLWRPDRFTPPRYEGELFPGTNYRMSELEAAVDLVQLGKLDAVCGRFRHVSRRIRRQLITCREIVPQKINDVDGALGYSLRFFPANCDLSRKLVEALKAEGLSVGTRGPNAGPDWHLSRFMFPLILRTGHTPGGSVTEDPRYLARGGKAEYRPGDCPVAEDLYAREVSMHLDQWYNDADCDAVARGLNKVLAACCTEDAQAPKWI
jgi:dTDP-4-amino-4,6-dideoxygalactose transaminase